MKKMTFRALLFLLTVCLILTGCSTNEKKAPETTDNGMTEVPSSSAFETIASSAEDPATSEVEPETSIEEPETSEEEPETSVEEPETSEEEPETSVEEPETSEEEPETSEEEPETSVEEPETSVEETETSEEEPETSEEEPETSEEEPETSVEEPETSEEEPETSVEEPETSVEETETSVEEPETSEEEPETSVEEPETSEEEPETSVEEPETSEEEPETSEEEPETSVEEPETSVEEPESSDEEPETDPEPIDHVITPKNAAEYQIVYPSASKYLKHKEKAEEFCSAYNAKFGTKLSPVADTDAVDGMKTIVVGFVSDAEIKSLLAPLHDADSLIATSGNRILLISASENGLQDAIDRFWDTYYTKSPRAIQIAAETWDPHTEFLLSDNLAINGVSITKYRIVFPAYENEIYRYIAFALYDYFARNAGVTPLHPVTDNQREIEYEILIGPTNREASKKLSTISFGNAEYIFCADGNNKLVFQGLDMYAGSAVYEFISKYFPDDGSLDPLAYVDATGFPTEPEVKSFTFPEATSVIMMIGDGMGSNHIESALQAGTISHFFGYDLPYQTWCKTYSVSGTTDSAASATALATGYKTINGYVGKNSSGSNVVNVSEVAASVGANVAVITTDLLDGATPSGFNVHSISRTNSAEILEQFSAKLKKGSLMIAKGKDEGVTGLFLETRKALQTISEKNSRFFIMIEEAYTDKGSHSNNLSQSNNAVKNLNEAIGYSIAFVMLHPDTALIITADHETGGLTKASDGTFYYTTTGHTNTNVPYFALGGKDVADFINTDETLENVWNAMFIASVYGRENFGDPNYRYNK